MNHRGNRSNSRRTSENFRERESRRETVENVIRDLIQNSPDAVAKPLESKLFDRLQEQPKRVSQVIMPALAPAIRQTVQRSMMNMFDATTGAIDQGLSLRSWAWRLRAWRSGKRYSEIAMMESLLFEVEDVLLIDRHAGLLIEHVSRSSAVSDPAIVSGMLTAIRDFVKDSFDTGDDQGAELSQFRVGQRSILVEPGSKAILALAVRGAPTYELRMKTTNALLDIHRECLGSGLSVSPAERTAITTKLEPLLITERKKLASLGKPVLLLLAALIPLLLAFAAFQSHQKKATIEDFATLRDAPGFLLGHVEHRDGSYHVYGSHDPVLFEADRAIAELGLQNKRVDWHLKKHLSLEDAALKKRAVQALTPPSGVDLYCENGVLRVSGTADAEWVGACRAFASVIPGIQRVEIDPGLVKTTVEHPLESPVKPFLHPPVEPVLKASARSVAATPTRAIVDIMDTTVEPKVENTIVPTGQWSNWK